MATPIQYNAYGNEYATDQAAIDRQRKLAEVLQAQSMAMPGTESIGGVAIRRSPLEGLARLGEAYAGSKISERADSKEKELAKTYAQSLADTLKRAQDNPDQAAQILTQHPATQALGLTAVQQDIQQRKRQAILAAVLGGKPMPSVANPENPMGTNTAPGTAAGMAPPANGAALGIPDKVTQLMMSGDPEMVALGKSILESGKGIAQRPGAPVVNPWTGAVIAQPTPSVPPGVQLNVGPNGASASQVPGAQQAMAALTASQSGAQAAGALPYHPPTVVNTPGAPTLMTPEQQIRAATGAPPPPVGQQGGLIPPRPGQSAESAAVPRQTDALKNVDSGNSRLTDRAKILQEAYAEESAKRFAPGSADAERQAANLASMQREYNGLKLPAGAPPVDLARGPGGMGLRLQDQGEAAQQVAGGKELAQLQYDAPQARAAVADGISNLQRLREQAEKIKNDPSLSRITGLTGMFPNMPGGHAADVQARLDTLKSQAGFGALQAMRAASKTGGALGSVSDRENDLLQRNIGALDKAQSESAIKESLQQIIDYADSASMRLHRAYQDQYERVQGNQGMQVTPKGAVKDGQLSPEAQAIINKYKGKQ